jgi:hypothetical protein
VKRLFALLAGLAFVISAPLACAKESRVSEPMKKILRERLVDRFELKIEDLTKLELTKEQLADMAAADKFEIFKLPSRPGVADDFHYQIFRSRKDNTYIILRTGGFAGVHEYYGPKKATTAEK